MDLNHDGWDDLVFARNKGYYDLHAYLLCPLGGPEAGVFQALPFTNLHDQDPSFFDFVQVFGHKNISYRTVKLLRADLDGDGDDDIFVGRNHANYVFRNLTTTPWDITDVDPVVTQRFERHDLDSISITNNGSQVFPETEAAYTVKRLWFSWRDKSVHPDCRSTSLQPSTVGAPPRIASPRRAGRRPLAGPRGLRTPDQPCAVGNGLCETEKWEHPTAREPMRGPKSSPVHSSTIFATTWN